MIYMVENTKYLAEFPYIQLKDGTDFDFQFELFKDKMDIIDFLGDILKGKKKKDKYNNTIQLKTWEDKTDFIDTLKTSSMFKQMVRSMFTPVEQELLNIMLYQGFYKK